MPPAYAENTYATYDVTYPGSQRLNGSFHLDCRSNGFWGPQNGGTMVASASTFLAEEFTTTWNETRILGSGSSATSVDDRRITSRIIGAGQRELEIRARSSIVILEGGWPGSRAGLPLETFSIQANVTDLTAASVTRSILTNPIHLRHSPTSPETSVDTVHGALLGNGRPYHVATTKTRIAGDFTIYLEEADLKAESWSYSAPAHTQSTAVASLADAAEIRHVTETYILVRALDSRIETDLPPQFSCLESMVEGSGSFSLLGARGTVEAGGASYPVGSSEFNGTGGTVSFQEAVDHETEEVRSSGFGSFSSLAIAFEPVAFPLAVPAVAVATAVGVAGLFWFAGKGAWLLYSRLREDRVPQGHRGALLRAVEQAPWSSIAEISRNVGMPRSTLRHHLRVLGKAGTIRVQRLGRTTLVTAKKLGVSPARSPAQHLLWSLDMNKEVRFQALQRKLELDHGYGRVGAWKALRAACAAEGFPLEKRGKSLWIIVGR